MKLMLSEEQRLLSKTAEQFMQEHSPASRTRRLRDARDPLGFSWSLWRSMAELGWVGCHLPEELGGAGLGFLELCLVMQAAGRTLVPEPFVSTALLGAEALSLAGSAAQQTEFLPKIAGGEIVVTLAYQEKKSRYDAQRIVTTAERDDHGFVISGEKIQVLDAHVARALIVSARTRDRLGEKDGISLFVVDSGARGVEVVPQQRIDGRNAASVRLDGVRVTEAATLGAFNRGASVLERILDIAAIGLSAEMLGGATRAFELTLDYLKQRHQFGVPIGSFQALQHRAARLYIELELARSCVLAAALAVDEHAEQLPRLAALAKARCSDTFVQVTNEAVQMHGGIGVTDEHDIGLYLKRARAADVLFGDAAWHRQRWAALGGY